VRPCAGAHSILVRRSFPTLDLTMHRGTTNVWGPTPEALLATAWKGLSAEDLARYLRRLIVAERKCIAGEFSRRVAPRLRWRRVAAARLLASYGHAVDRQVFSHPNARSWSSGERTPNVPPRYSWRGVFSLVPLHGAADEV
jgi:hypothetical protein